MGRFWIEDDFIRQDIKKYKLTSNAALVYLALCSHVDKNRNTFIGTRRLADMLNMSKSTVARAIKELESVPLVGHRKTKLSQLHILSVPSVSQTVPQVGQKEAFKEVFKEEKNLISKKTEETPYNPDSPSYKNFLKQRDKMFRSKN